jgi:hypothetical protein
MYLLEVSVDKGFEGLRFAREISGTYLVIRRKMIPFPKLPFLRYHQASYDASEFSPHLHVEPSQKVLRMKEGDLFFNLF